MTSSHQQLHGGRSLRKPPAVMRARVTRTASPRHACIRPPRARRRPARSRRVRPGSPVDPVSRRRRRRGRRRAPASAGTARRRAPRPAARTAASRARRRRRARGTGGSRAAAPPWPEPSTRARSRGTRTGPSRGGGRPPAPPSPPGVSAAPPTASAVTTSRRGGRHGEDGRREQPRREPNAGPDRQRAQVGLPGRGAVGGDPHPELEERDADHREARRTSPSGPSRQTAARARRRRGRRPVGRSSVGTTYAGKRSSSSVIAHACRSARLNRPSLLEAMASSSVSGRTSRPVERDPGADEPLDGRATVAARAAVRARRRAPPADASPAAPRSGRASARRRP